eukprot:GHRQ01018626.1.p3 GENE.GHRQ01018626.1~~GHRQ01018626.1.p3  ORF type:complete len:153 (-),score=46.84 GHRQ01018626.1:781-1239(-)
MPVAFLAGACRQGRGPSDGWLGSSCVAVAALIAEAAGAAGKVLRQCVVLFLVYFAYILLVQPILRSPSAPAAAVLGEGACFSSDGSAGSGGAALSRGGLLFSAVLWLAAVPGWVLGRVRAAVCREVLSACQEGLWVWPQDCMALFQQPAGPA